MTYALITYGLLVTLKTWTVVSWTDEWKHLDFRVISGFHREVDENCALMGYYEAINGNFYRRFGTTYLFRPKWFLNLEYATDNLSRKVGNKSPLLAA